MNPVQYIILDRALGMSAGKCAAQAAHASQLGLLSMVEFDHGRNPYDKSIVNRWMRGGHYAKVVLQVNGNDQLRVAKEYIEARGFSCALIIDEGRTELDGLTPTALGTGVVDKDSAHVRETFGEFKLYGSPPPPPRTPRPTPQLAPRPPRLRDRFWGSFSFN